MNHKYYVCFAEKEQLEHMPILYTNDTKALCTSLPGGQGAFVFCVGESAWLRQSGQIRWIAAIRKANKWVLSSSGAIGGVDGKL